MIQLRLYRYIYVRWKGRDLLKSISPDWLYFLTYHIRSHTHTRIQSLVNGKLIALNSFRRMCDWRSYTRLCVNTAKQLPQRAITTKTKKRKDLRKKFPIAFKYYRKAYVYFEIYRELHLSPCTGRYNHFRYHCGRPIQRSLIWYPNRVWRLL